MCGEIYLLTGRFKVKKDARVREIHQTVHRGESVPLDLDLCSAHRCKGLDQLIDSITL